MSDQGSPATPRTEAGRILLDSVFTPEGAEGAEFAFLTTENGLRLQILAIEAEAREDAAAGLREALLDIEQWTKPTGSPGMDGTYGGQIDGRGTVGRVWRRARTALDALAAPAAAADARNRPCHRGCDLCQTLDAMDADATADTPEAAR